MVQRPQCTSPHVRRFNSSCQCAQGKGAGKELGLHSQTLQVIAGEYVTRRKQFKKSKLNWRKLGGPRRSLGWVPVNTGAARWKNGQVFHNGHYFKVWDSYGLADYRFRSVSFSEDSRGRWYFNVVVDAEVQVSKGQDQIGIDLGLKKPRHAATVAFLKTAGFTVILNPLWQSPNGPARRCGYALFTPRLPTEGKMLYTNSVGRWLSAAA